tara:strand:- start:1070 stop:2485 length:1416 start_codon:yes stop_codon:yes gene_type:complete
MTKPLSIILASGSAGRKAMLDEVNISYEAIPADIDEQAIIQDMAAEMSEDIAQELAKQKALAIAKDHPEKLVIGSDQILVFEGKIISKAKTREEAAEKLTAMSGKTHSLISALSVVQGSQLLFAALDHADLTMKDDPAYLASYIQSADDSTLLSCVGAYKIEENGKALFSEIKGDKYTIMGMPLLELLDYLEKEQGLELTKTGVIGHPIAHSKSPLIHGYWIKKYGLQGTYSTIDIPPETLEEGVNDLIAKGYKGFNVTVPHKVAIMDLCNEIDETAKVIGAVNTIVIEDGKLWGSNTDAFGFIQNIKEQQPDFVFTKGAAIVLGAGGAARAIIYGLIKAGVPEIILTNRTKAKAEELAGHFSDLGKVSVMDWDRRVEALAGANLLVNTTALGMSGKAQLEISLEELPPEALVCDIVYAPLMTDLLSEARERGNNIVTGIGMLLHQARPGFELWHGQSPEVTEEVERLVLK